MQGVAAAATVRAQLLRTMGPSAAVVVKSETHLKRRRRKKGWSGGVQVLDGHQTQTEFIGMRYHRMCQGSTRWPGRTKYTSVPRIFCLDLGLLNASALTANVNFSGAICCVVGSRVRLALP